MAELVCEEAINAYTEIPPLVEPVEPAPHALDKLPQPMSPKWPLEKFEQCLDKRVQRKDARVKDGSLCKSVPVQSMTA